MTKKHWELMDKNNDNREQMECDGDNGLANMIGVYIKHADSYFCDYFKGLCLASKSESRELRRKANEQLSKAAS